MNKIEVHQFAHFVKAIDPSAKFIAANSLKGGLSAQTMLIEYETEFGGIIKIVLRRPPSWVLQKNPLPAESEFQLLIKLYSLGLKIPKPIFLDQEGKFFGTPALSVKFDEGSTNFASSNISETVMQMATELAKIHNVTSKELVDVSVSKDIQLFPRKPETNYSLSEIRALNCLELNWPIKLTNEPVLIHGDFWPGNLIWQNGSITSVIDWEASGLSDPLLDVAISRLDILWLFGKSAMDEFTDIYKKNSSIDFTNLPLWDLWAALRTGGKFSLWASIYPPLGRPDVTEEIMRERHDYFVQQAFDELSSS